MKKKAVIISSIAGIFILGVKIAFGSRDMAVIENVAIEESVASDEANEQVVQETTEPKEPEEVQTESEKPEGENPEGMESEEPEEAQS